MAESCAKAFGRYLKTLRERRGLALDDVATLSKSYADPVAKSYLSRVENGIFSLALSKMIPLCRIYDIPTDVLIQRLELDSELEKIGGPVTDGMPFSELLRRGKHAHERGLLWHAYAYYRDSGIVALSSELAPNTRDLDEQLQCAYVALATAAEALGRYCLALHELMSVQASGQLGVRLSALVQDRLALAYLHSGNFPAALQCADEAISVAVENKVDDLLGFFYSDRAAISRRQGDFETAISFHQRAFEAFKSADREIECSRSLHALAIAYFFASRPSAARRALAASERLATRHGQMRILGLVRLLTGDLDYQAANHRQAVANWRAAAEIARSLNDRDLEFQAHYYLFRSARDAGDRVQARSLRKSLMRMASWVRSDLTELTEFRSCAESS